MACTGATTDICTGLTNAEPCQVPKVYNPAFPELEHVLLSYDGGGIFTIDWDIDTSYPTHIVKAFIREASVPYFTEDGLEIVPRDDGTLTVPAIEGRLYRITIRTESPTEHCKCITVEIAAEEITDYPLGEDLIVFINEEVLFGTEFVYA